MASYYDNNYESAAPRTPSPYNSSSPPMQPIQYKPQLHQVPPLFAEHDDNGIPPESAEHYYRQPSLLSELYDEPAPQQEEEWQRPAPESYHMVRRATFPYVRGDYHHQPQYTDTPLTQEPENTQVKMEDSHNGFVLPPSDDSYYYQQQAQQQQPSAQPSAQYTYPQVHHHPIHPIHHSPHMSPSHHLPSLPSHTQYHPHLHHHSLSPHLSPLPHPHSLPHTHPSLPVQHTDDAASKETQFLRRRCFNCHTTEPPSWRRSTLNPGKIVCNKCGLYERTHLRPRPLRFDELRAGNKGRKGSKNSDDGAGGIGKMKKETSGYGAPLSNGLGGSSGRRSSVSSSSSATGALSDWDDNGGSSRSSVASSPSPTTPPSSLSPGVGVLS
ncbi:hypothetical protein VNI00_005796 [Paramarasmius palmivorus]|uniref:GATA-type domain-containing protein n=1 Tax=Paramarasmius palmivorus TaxID=297713 RepID=A0AAW0DFL8_9AGAR